MSLPKNNPWFFLVYLLSITIYLGSFYSKGLDSINSGQFLTGNQTVSSHNGRFELGFFTPAGNSGQNYYLGIWYSIQPNKTVVWVANRNQPISDPYASELKLLQDGNLVLLNHSKQQIWATNSISRVANSTTAMLLDSGNFVVREKSELETDSSHTIIWQSFDYPTDTLLPGGKLGYNKLRNENLSLTAWRSLENPATSLFSLRQEPNGTSFMLVWNGSKVYWSTGEWTGKSFRSVPEIALNFYTRNFSHIENENESYLTYEAAYPIFLTRIVIDVTGLLKQYVWGLGVPGWSQFYLGLSQPCDVYGFCGAFGSCNEVRTPTCNCLQGFEPRVQQDWESGVHTDGCVRKHPPSCNNTGLNDTFTVVPNSRFPVDAESLRLESNKECELACLGNCSCTGYAYDDNGCLVWNGELFNLVQLSANDTTGKDFHVRIAESDNVVVSVANTRRKKTTKNIFWIIIGAIGFTTFLIAIVLLTIWRRRQKAGTLETDGLRSLVVFKYRDLRSATNNFSEKLGEGGFGSVFKGTLPNSSSAIAVKRLNSPKQGEGMEQEKQFRAEVSTIGMIQHINLVRLRGFCIEGGAKRFLVYDYMMNGSLESHLFRKNYSNADDLLDWKTRYKVVMGTARGMAYLHEKCRECIIHCDIKPENILLDAEFNPKVADFGLAKLIGREFSRVLTTMRGTRGYLAPEWISGEAITTKADVYSYGMLLFEIISGKRNSDLIGDGTNHYFPVRVAHRLNDRKEVLLELLDQRLGGNADLEELSRACKIACWCVQDDEKDRPTMGRVVQILEGASELGIPPIPQFLQTLTGNPMESSA